MKFSAVFLALCVGSANGFAPSRPTFAGVAPLMDAAVAEPEAESAVEAPVAPPAALSGLRMKNVRKAIDDLSADNFESTLASLESYLTNEARSQMYSKSIHRIQVRASALGLTVPEGYAKEAKATLKRREKQNAFIQQKEEGRMAAEAAAAEAAAAPAEEEAAEEAAEPVAA